MKAADDRRHGRRRAGRTRWSSRTRSRRAVSRSRRDDGAAPGPDQRAAARRSRGRRPARVELRAGVGGRALGGRRRGRRRGCWSSPTRAAAPTSSTSTATRTPRCPGVSRSSSSRTRTCSPGGAPCTGRRRRMGSTLPAARRRRPRAAPTLSCAPTRAVLDDLREIYGFDGGAVIVPNGRARRSPAAASQGAARRRRRPLLGRGEERRSAGACRRREVGWPVDARSAPRRTPRGRVSTGRRRTARLLGRARSSPRPLATSPSGWPRWRRRRRAARSCSETSHRCARSGATPPLRPAGRRRRDPERALHVLRATTSGARELAARAVRARGGTRRRRRRTECASVYARARRRRRTAVAA